MTILNSDNMYRIRTYSRDQDPSKELFTVPPTFETYIAQDRECWHLGISSAQTIYHVHKFIPILIELDKICDYNFARLKSKTRIKDYVTFHN